MENVITPELAAIEVSKWLDRKKVSPTTREKYNDAIEQMAEAIVDGTMTIDEDGIITHVLKFPVKSENGETSIEELKYQPRIDSGTVAKKLQNVKQDLGGISAAYGSALTGKTIGIINKLDTEDGKLLKAIVVFFL